MMISTKKPLGMLLLVINEHADLLTFCEKQLALSHFSTSEISYFALSIKSCMSLPFSTLYCQLQTVRSYVDQRLNKVMNDE